LEFRPDHPTDRRWRLDEMGPNPGNHARQISGRKAVVALVLTILALWLVLDLSFRSWKARYNALAEFGASKVAPAIDPLARTLPPDVPPNDWRVAVADTHAMLLALTGAGVLDQPQMEQLRQDINQRVAQARPETAVKTLAGLWDDLERQAGPVIAPDSTPPPPSSRHAARNPRPARPRLLGPPSLEAR
jgi:hypothetical protein